MGALLPLLCSCAAIILELCLPVLSRADTLYCSPEASDEEDEENKWTTSFATVSQTKEEEIEEEAEVGKWRENVSGT